MNTSYINIALYLSVNLLLFSSFYIVLFRKRDSLLFVDRIIGTFISGLSQIILTEILLGTLFERLSAFPLFLLNVSISFIVIIIALILQNRRTAYGIRDFLKSMFAEVRYEIFEIIKTVKGDWILLCISGLFFVSVCWMVFLAYLFPPFTWDSLWYHLPTVGYIMQNGVIHGNPMYSFIDAVTNVLPQNMELFFLWNVIFLKTDTMVDIIQPVFTILGVLTIYSLALKLKIKKKHAILSAFLFFFTPVIILLSTANYVDVAVSVLFLVAVNFLIYDIPDKFIGDPSGRQLKDKKIPIIMFGLASGILLGSKGSGPLFIIVLSIAIVIQEVIKLFCSSDIGSLNKRYLITRALKLYLLCFALPAILVGGFWYINNWMLYGNPQYVMEVSFRDITLFKGIFKGIIDPAPAVIDGIMPLKKLLHVWLEKVEYYLYDSRLSGFGPLWFILFLPSLAFSLIYAVKREEYGFLFVNAILIIIFVLYPRNWYTRYVIYIVGLGSLSFGLALNYFDKREGALKIVALLLACYTFLTVNSPCIMPEKIKEFLHLPVSERTIARHAPFNIDFHARQHYGYWTWIRKNLSKGDMLAYNFEPLFLRPLWNREFSNRIIFIRSDTYKEWVKDLKMNKTTYILIKRNSTESRWIDKERRILSSLQWLGSFKEKFKDVYSDDNYKILKLLEDQG